jgi:hypothetical protein
MRVVAVLAVASLIVGACGGAGAPTPTPGTSTSVTPSPTTAPIESTAPTGPAATTAPSTPSGTDATATADLACRASTFRDPGLMTLSVVVGEMVTIVYAGAEGDFLCQWLPRYGDTAVVQGGFTHFADQLTPQTPIVRDQNLSFTSETGTYAWGAVSAAVASLVLEPESGDPIEASIANGSFLAILPPGVPCCLFTLVAFDADGHELAGLQ